MERKEIHISQTSNEVPPHYLACHGKLKRKKFIMAIDSTELPDIETCLRDRNIDYTDHHEGCTNKKPKASNSSVKDSQSISIFWIVQLL